MPLVLMLAGGTLAADSARAGAQPVNREQLLQRTAAHVQQFIDNLTNVVAEEEYLQQFRQAAGRRRLRSDFLLVRYPGEERLYVTFRDVLAVDSRPVRDQQERLTKLFLEPFDSAVRRAGEIQREGLRHSIERGRLADPLDVIAYLQGRYHDNFAFSLGGYVPALGADVREVELTQVIPPGSRAVAVRAKAWIAERSGRVVRTELTVGTGAGARFTTTTFGVDPGLRIAVPVEMRDSAPVGLDEFQGRATYRNFRRFEVRAQEDIQAPPATPR